MIILGIETSCDETGVGIIEYDPALGLDSAQVLADEVASSVELHARFGGVVPEIASRAHVEALSVTVEQALVTAGVVKPDAVVVTVGPGLVGALMVGIAAAKAYALAWNVPLYALNHLVGHVAVDTLEHGALPDAIALLVSGGHTNLLQIQSRLTGVVDLGGTIDDAAGEAFDKIARIMGLPYPGGPQIDSLARQGNPRAIAFPRSLADEPYNFSFSGLKTAVARYMETTPDYYLPDVAASFQEAIADSLTVKATQACRRAGVATLVLGGGATANTRIRERIAERCCAEGIELRIPMPRRCTDNGVMMAALGAHYISAGGKPASLGVGCYPQLAAHTIGVVE